MSIYTESDYIAMAAAGGYEIHRITEPDEEGFFRVLIILDGHVHDWQPDTFPADCFRLMVDADITVRYSIVKNAMSATHEFTGEKIDITLTPIRDKLAATMKAICDVAIAIGSQNGRESNG